MTLRLHVELYHCSTEEPYFHLLQAFVGPVRSVMQTTFCRLHDALHTLHIILYIALFSLVTGEVIVTSCIHRNAPVITSIPITLSLTLNWFIEHTSIHTYGAF